MKTDIIELRQNFARAYCSRDYKQLTAAEKRVIDRQAEHFLESNPKLENKTQ